MSTDAPATSDLDSLVGPFLTASSTIEMLGVTEQALEARRRARTVLALTTSDHQEVYPTFQFTDGRIDPDLALVFRELSGVPPWSAALWLVTPDPDLLDLTPVNWVRKDHPLPAVLVAAQRIVHDRR